MANSEWKFLVLFYSLLAIRHSPNNKAGGTPADATTKIRTHRGAARAQRGARAYRRSTAALAAANQRRRSAPDALPVGVDGPRRHRCARMRSLQISNKGSRPWTRLSAL